MVVCATAAQAQKYVGGDISLLSKYETNGAQYLDKDGKVITGGMLNYLKQQGWNAMRVRLFVDPSKAPADHKAQGVCQDLEYVKTLGKQIKDAGLSFMLDFHYSDTWTDPGKHATPSSWSSSVPDVLATKLYDYTKECLNELKAAGATPDFIQPGNEITYGMLWPTGHCYPDGGDHSGGTFANFAKYLQAGIQAIRETCPQAKIVVQTELSRTDNVTNFYKTLAKYTNDYDVIGLSYYPYYHGALSSLNSVLTSLENTYKDKKIQLVETGYYHAWYPDDAKYKESSFPNWPATDAGQLQFAKDLIEMLGNHENVNGLYWWWPEANENGLDWNTKRVTDGWYNAGLFDNSNGRAMQALYELKNFVGDDSGSGDDPGTDQPTDITAQFKNMDFESCTVSGGSVTDCPGWNIIYDGWNDGPWPKAADQWHSGMTSGYLFQGWCEHANALVAGDIISQSMQDMPAGTYTVTAVVHTDYDGIVLFANNDTQAVNATTDWGTAYLTTVTTTLTEPGTLTLGLKVAKTSTSTGEVNLYADNFTCSVITTGIADAVLMWKDDSKGWYTLSGQRLSAQPAQKGIYIHNGKKVLIGK